MIYRRFEQRKRRSLRSGCGGIEQLISVRGILPILKNIIFHHVIGLPSAVEAKALAVSRLAVFSVCLAWTKFLVGIRGIVNHFNDLVHIAINTDILHAIGAVYFLLCWHLSYPPKLQYKCLMIVPGVNPIKSFFFACSFDFPKAAVAAIATPLNFIMPHIYSSSC